MPDLKKYLERIKYTCEIKNDVSTLSKLCRHHQENIPFENLDLFGGKRKFLDFEKIFNDMVVKKRGGFCYEQNSLLHWALTEFGFKVIMIQGQVQATEEMGFGPRFDHLALLVTCGNGSEWLADVGFTSYGFTTPLKLETEIEQTQNNGVYKLQGLNENEFLLEKLQKTVIQPDGNILIMYYKNIRCYIVAGRNILSALYSKGTTKHVSTGKEWKPLYKFDIIPRKWEDFKEMCDYQQDNENNFLKNNTLCSKQSEFGSVALWGWSACEKVFLDSMTEKIKWKRNAKDQDELKEILKQHFQIEIDFDLNALPTLKSDE
ncbi:arylamine N-acetyltransferase 1-like [Ciona intestinalis]